MKRILISVIACVVMLTMVLSINAFAAVGDAVENVCLHKNITEITGEYWGIADYTPWAESMGQPEPNFRPPYLVDGIWDGWGIDRFITGIPKAALEIDLGGYYTLNTLKTSYLYSTEANGESPSKETTIQVSTDGKNWTTVIEKQPLSTDSEDLVKLLDSTMHIYATEFDLGGVLASKIRIAYNNTETEQGFNLMEIACSGVEAEAPAEQPGGSDDVPPDTFDGLSAAVVVAAASIGCVVLSKKRR